jgi:hypothetical protein
VLKIKFLIPLLFTLLVVACKKEKTTWGSDWVVPLVNDTLDIKQLENDSTLGTTSNGFYTVDLSRTVLNIGLSDLLEVPDTSIVQDFVLAVPSINVPPGYTIVNEIEEHQINIPGAQLKRIRVSSGVIRVKVFNPVATICFFNVQLPGVTKNGQVFSQNYSVPAAIGGQPGIATAELDISGYTLDLTGVNGNLYNTLQSMMVITSDPAGGSILITNQQVFKVEAKFENIRMDYARGYFGQRSFTDTTNYVLNVLDVYESGALDIPGSFVQIEIENGIKISAKARITSVQNTNALGNTLALSSPQIGNDILIDQASGSWNTLTNSVTQLEFTPTNSNLEEYIENLGKDHQLGFGIYLNPWGNVSGGWDEVFPNSRLKVKVKAQLPLSLGMDDLTLRDTFNIDLKQDKNLTHVESGELVLNATNAFPFSGKLQLFFLGENGAVLHTVNPIEKVESSVYGVLDPITGLKKKQSQVAIPLGISVINDLDLIKKVVVRVKLDTPDELTGNNVLQPIPAGAFMAVKLKANFRLKAVL